jgi:hypothetical protein
MDDYSKKVQVYLKSGHAFVTTIVKLKKYAPAITDWVVQIKPVHDDTPELSSFEEWIKRPRPGEPETKKPAVI